MWWNWRYRIMEHRIVHHVCFRSRRKRLTRVHKKTSSWSRPRHPLITSWAHHCDECGGKFRPLGPKQLSPYRSETFSRMARTWTSGAPMPLEHFFFFKLGTKTHVHTEVSKNKNVCKRVFRVEMKRPVCPPRSVLAFFLPYESTEILT